MTQLALLTLFALTVPTVSSVPCKFLIPLFAIPVYRYTAIPYQIASNR